jgi:Transposase
MISDGEKGGTVPTRKHSEVQIIEALRQVEAGRTAAEVGRELGVKPNPR